MPAGKATEESAFVGRVQVKLVVVPASDEQGTLRYETVISDSWKIKDAGLVRAIVIVWPDRVAVLTTGVAAELNE